jgi:hypothetical protein
MSRRKLHWLLPLMIGALGAALGTYAAVGPKGPAQPAVMPVEAGVLYRSPQLPAGQLADEVQRRGIKTVINLGSHAGIDEGVCRQLGVSYVECAVGDVWRMCGQRGPGDREPPSDPYDLSPLWKLIDDPASRPVLIHCQGGIHRTGVFAAMYRIHYQAWQPDDAIKEMDLFGFNSYKPKFDNVTAYLRTLTDDIRQAKANTRGAQRR